MVSDGSEPIHHPFGGFRVRTEAMPDGRRIQYYTWPAEGEGEGEGEDRGGTGEGPADARGDGAPQGPGAVDASDE